MNNIKMNNIKMNNIKRPKKMAHPVGLEPTTFEYRLADADSKSNALQHSRAPKDAWSSIVAWRRSSFSRFQLIYVLICIQSAVMKAVQRTRFVFRMCFRTMSVQICSYFKFPARHALKKSRNSSLAILRRNVLRRPGVL